MDYVEEHFLSLYDIVLVQNTLENSFSLAHKGIVYIAKVYIIDIMKMIILQNSTLCKSMFENDQTLN